MKHFADHASLRQWALSSLTIIFGWCAFSQDIAMGTWRTHFSYKDARHIAITPDKIFCATANGLFSWEINSGSIRKLSKIDGLSDVGVSALAYDENLNVLVIGYRSGFMDFVYEDELLSISDLGKSNLEGDKTINDIAFGEAKTYLATDLGVIVVNTATAEISENYVQIGTGGNEVEVLEVIFKNDSLFIRTDEGIQVGTINSNLLDFNNWTHYPSTASYANLILIEAQMYATSGASLRLLSAGAWQGTGVSLPAAATKLFEVEGELVTSADGIIYMFDGSAFQTSATTEALAINDLGIHNGVLVIADGVLGLFDEGGSVASPSGPLSDSISNFRIIANQLYTFHAPSVFTYDGSQQVSSFSIFKEGEWQEETIEDFGNVSDVARYNGSFYYSSIGKGLYDESSQTTIKNIPGSSAELDTIVTTLATGEKLWVSSFGNSNPIHTMDSDQSWTSYSNTLLAEDEFLSVDLSEIGIGWLGTSSGAITVFDPAENQVTIADGLPSSFIDIDIGIEDNAWVGTTKGPAFFPSASFIFSNPEGILPSFESRTLFKDEQINAVMTDGGNRIWFGTMNGLWVYDENISELVAIFNEENSPLPSNEIIRLTYNGSNGEVFISTAKGMVSFRSSSSTGRRDHRNVNIFPNPVRPDYQGLVGLTGLARNANVKITDVSGNVVKEINANGGSASWDLNNSRGSRISTGVYLFFSSTSNGEETYVGKIAVIR